MAAPARPRPPAAPRSFLEYLSRLEDKERWILFSDTFSALTLFRSLPPLAKQYVMRLLNVEHPVTLGTIQRWCTPGALRQHQDSMSRLLELGIFQLTLPASQAQYHQQLSAATAGRQDGGRSSGETSGGSTVVPTGSNFGVLVHTADPKSTVLCNPVFARSVRAALANQLPELRDESLSADKFAPSKEQLAEFARNRWNSILHYMVGSMTDEPPDQGVRKLLLKMGLMRRCSKAVMREYQKQVHLNKEKFRQDGQRISDDEDYDEDEEEAEWGESEEVKRKRREQQMRDEEEVKYAIIAGKGFSFLFRDIHAQIWQIVMAYIASLEERNLNKEEVLLLLFRLAFLEQGKDYPVLDKTPSQQCLIEDLYQFGLLYKRKSNSRRFYPTPLTLCLSPNPPPLEEKESEQGFLIVETTFRVYSFSTSPLQQSLFQMFVKMEYDLPTMMIGTITKASVHNALRHGIRARDIVAYMTECAHPEQRKRVPLLPTNVIDQLFLWERDQSRLVTQPAVLYSFPVDRSNPVFRESVQQFKHNRAFLWNDSHRLMATAGNWDASLRRIRVEVQKELLKQMKGSGDLEH